MNVQTSRKTTKFVIEQILKHCDLKNGYKILEPSAGSGDLVDGILKHNPNVTVDCIELNKELREELIEIGYTVVGEDFFNFTPTWLVYDYVIACPTYKDNIDVEHIMHMYECVKPGGSVVSLTSPHWTIKNSERQKTFRKWLEDKDYYMVMLHDYSFIENFETQPSALIKITKHDS